MGRTLATIGLSLLAGVVCAQQDVYRDTDEDGTPSYSDVPQQPDSEKLDVPNVNVVPSPKTTQFRFDYDPPKTEPKYGTLKVTAPENDAVVYIRTTNILIRVDIVPPARSDLGHRLQITFDGEVLTEGSTSYTLDDANRGTHAITARVVDAQGRTVAESEPVKVHIKKPTVQ